MPGNNDCITVVTGNEKVKVQEQMVSGSLTESFVKFKHPLLEMKIKFSKFAPLWPNKYKLAVASDTCKL